MSEPQVAPWTPDDRDEVIDFIVSIQQGEFDLPSEVDTMLLFRDHLRRDAADRQQYAAAKLDLATRRWAIVQDDADARSDIVADIMSRAR